VGDGDDDQQVESCSEHRDGGQQNVNENPFELRRLWFPAGIVEKWKAEFSSFWCLHRQRVVVEAAEFWECFDCRSLIDSGFIFPPTTAFSCF